jgi:hypothetical protein
MPLKMTIMLNDAIFECSHNALTSRLPPPPRIRPFTFHFHSTALGLAAFAARVVKERLVSSLYFSFLASQPNAITSHIADLIHNIAIILISISYCLPYRFHWVYILFHIIFISIAFDSR